MKEIKTNKTTTFTTGHDDFIIDIVETIDHDEPMFETWLYRENMGHKMFVTGEYKKYYPNITIRQYARTCLDYLRTVGSKGMDTYDIYDQETEDLETATWQRIENEKLSTCT